MLGAFNYTVTAAPQNSSLPARTSTTANTMQTILNLEPGEVYNVTVSATYNTGTGEDSAVVQQVTGEQINWTLLC